ncbi:glucose-1-phosphate cytidylyltransferase [Altererythrobacter sp. BO-6]|uniref:glucose-1-phosphate cytidylyltransferase n=1 Tax=Altererythrobacter sp. BO-6 TaxID=2604537 RepID=UPI0013E192DA|nr:glucose-1-phosphate cytidylyltransferase [Altererythrobacter sp. BO-6]QIG55310.1 glucose-1-phosphate cytidylyltransferase [Altererythrobacter sp. BO-6]
MKAVILAGGLGTRLSEETSIRPKPMVEIGGKPILWHVMRHYAHFGIKEFVVCCGYKGEYIKDYFLNYRNITSDFTIDLGNGEIHFNNPIEEDWKVTLIDTGADSMTGGRIARVRQAIGDNPFCLTYGDGVSNVPIDQLLEYHASHGKWATVTAVRQPGRFGALGISEEGISVTGFREKGIGDGGYINGGFYVCEPQVFDLIEDDATVWEREPMERLVELSQLVAFRHEDFWQCMDTLRDKSYLEEVWASPDCPWRLVYSHSSNHTDKRAPASAGQPMMADRILKAV